MKFTRAVFSVLTISLLVFGASAPASAISATWGVNLGDIAVYYVDEVKLSSLDNANLAVLLGEENRTNYVVVTDVGSDYVNYSLGLANDSSAILNQQIIMNSTSLSGFDIIIPSGDLPIILPLSAGTQSNYFEYMESSVLLLNSILDGFIGSDSNFSFIEDTQLSANYGDELRITANLELGSIANMTSLISEFVTGFNLTDVITLDEDQDITGGNASLSVYYNTTDGMLTTVDLSATLSTNTTTSEGFETGVLSMSASIIRSEFIRLLDDEGALSSASSFIADNPFYWMAGIPALFILLQRKKSS